MGDSSFMIFTVGCGVFALTLAAAFMSVIVGDEPEKPKK